VTRGVKEFCRYLPVSQRDRLWGLFAYGGGYAYRVPGFVNVSHPLPFNYENDKGRIFDNEYAALCVTEGVTEFDSEATGKILLSPGDCAILVPGLWHRYECYAGGATAHLWLAFGGTYADHLLRRGILSRRRIIFHTDLSERVLQPYRRALGMLQSNPVGIQQALAGSVLEILGATTSTTEQASSAGKLEELVLRAITLMEQRAESSLDTKTLAGELSANYDHFRHAFRRQTGHSPYQYHLGLRMRRAQELLLDPTLSVKQVAARLGFQDQFQFSKAFKEKTELSPTQWRRNAGI
jgi:AraC-like DNA-binding protein